MITRENIIHFYTKYKENLKTEDQIQENLLKAEDQEAWIENLKNKSRMMRRLYIENEALLNLYIRPFLDGEASLNEELAREFLHQIVFKRRGEAGRCPCRRAFKSDPGSQ